ncbi:hypothetical protein BDZ88DRAFT_417308 [Geranomyces variabilis]|nr:hypothetical protein BDZ88DRAFT_417308 [Geranomyces variabilis]KAJ3135327.1 hypothetical protein HDU90_004051 [Geranomyces variabilis]
MHMQLLPAFLLHQLLLIRLLTAAVVSGSRTDWNWWRTPPAAPLFFLNTPTAELDIDVGNVTATWKTSVLPGNTYYKVTAEGTFWTGTEEADAVCFYKSNGAATVNMCDSQSASNYGFYSLELGLQCGNSNYWPALFWTGAIGNAACPAYADSPDTVYTTYIYRNTSSTAAVDFFVRNKDSATKTWGVNSTSGGVLTYRRGITIKFYQAQSPTTVTATTTQTATVTRSMNVYNIAGGWGRDLTATSMPTL